MERNGGDSCFLFVVACACTKCPEDLVTMYASFAFFGSLG
jgi:hypothetical protein